MAIEKSARTPWIAGKRKRATVMSVANIFRRYMRGRGGRRECVDVGSCKERWKKNRKVVLVTNRENLGKHLFSKSENL